MHSESFKLEHMHKIMPAGGSKITRMMQKSLEYVHSIGKLSAFTLIHDGEIIAIAGVYEVWPGVGEAVSVLSESATRYPKALYSTFLSNLNTGISIGKFWRVQATVNVGFDAGVRFIERLGFHYEGIMKKWTPDGKDVYRYARLI